MFNLDFSTLNNSLKRFGMFVTRNDWIVNGKVLDVQERNNGFWIKIKSSAKIAGLYNFDKLEFDCFLPKEIAATSYKKDGYYKKLHASGKFVINNDNSYFVVKQMLV